MGQQSLADYDSQYLSTHRQRCINFLPISRSNQQRQQQHRLQASQPVHPSPLNQEVVNTVRAHHRNESVSSTTSSAATSRSSTSTSMTSHSTHGPISAKEASLKAQEIRPTSDVAEWAHQAHLRQGRSYWWCQGCFPKEVT